MAIKKTQLYSSLWASCDELRGGMDASQYKDYVLTFLFLKYVSDKHLNDPKAMIVVPDGCTFPDMVSLKGDKEIGEKLNIVLDSIAKENELPWLANKDNDFNDEERLGKGKEMVDRLSKLIGIFEGLDFGGNSAQDDDLLGDAYEYLMRNFATESGKSKGQFYTPAEVSRILAQVVGITKDTPQDQTVYDPTCGSGSLLLKAADEARNGLSIYGQEKEFATTALCRMNMILHNNADAEIAPGGHSTLAEPEFKQDNTELKTFDFAVANPPFSFKAWNTGFLPEEDDYARFEYGIPPEKNGDYAFLLHILKSLKSTGKGAVILPHGVLFRGGAEFNIRRNLIKQGYIKGIIGLPANLFYGTGVPACIIVIDKDGANKRLTKKGAGIFMIDASNGFIKDGAKNRLREQDLHKIVDVFNKQNEQAGYSRVVSFDEISGNDYNLNIPRYIDNSETEDLHDLSAHLKGGVPNRDINALDNYWQVFPELRHSLFKHKRKDYSKALVAAADVKTKILSHSEFKAFAKKSLALFGKWKKNTNLAELTKGVFPKNVIHEISESLLNIYSKASLLDKYDMFQIIMDYWAEVMQDDVYVIAQDDWLGGSAVRQIFPSKDKNGKNVWKETHDFEFKKERFKSEVIPPSLIATRFFESELELLVDYQQKLDDATQALDEFVEDHNGEEDLLAEVKNDKDNVTQKLIGNRIKALNENCTDLDELAALVKCLKLVKAEAAAKKAHKDFKLELDNMIFKKYPKLTEVEIKTLIVEDKWLATLQANIVAEIERVTQQLASRVKTLEERYSEPLPALIKSVEGLSASVDEHLKKMGLQW